MSFLPGSRELRKLGSSAANWIRTQPLDVATVAAGALLGVALYFVDEGAQARSDDAPGNANENVSLYPFQPISESAQRSCRFHLTMNQ